MWVGAKTNLGGTRGTLNSILTLGGRVLPLRFCKTSFKNPSKERTLSHPANAEKETGLKAGGSNRPFTYGCVCASSEPGAQVEVMTGPASVEDSEKTLGVQ